MMRFLSTILFVSMIGCQPIPDPDPIPGQNDDAGADSATYDCGTPAECACANLCVLECPECRIECVPSVEKILADRIMVFDPECVSAAKSKAAVRLCPGVSCR